MGLFQRGWFQGLLFVISALIIYFPSWRYGIVTDFLSWLLRYKSGSFADVWHCFDYPGLHQFFHLINYICFLFVDTSRFGWYLILSTMHGISAFAIFLWFKMICADSKFDRSNQLALLISLCFLIFPFNAEAVIWKACLHYLILTTLLFTAIRYLWIYLTTSKKNALTISLILYLLSLFTLELSFAFPLMSIVLVIYFHSQRSFSGIQKNVVSIIIPQWLILGGYFILTKLTVGAYVGHYGADKHLVFDPIILFGHAWSYFFKHLIFLHEWTFKLKSLVYEQWLTSPKIVYPLSFLAIIILIFCMWKWKRISKKLQFIILNVILFFIALAPVVNLYFMWLLGYENDRYGYFSSAFLIAAILGLIWCIPVKAIKNVGLVTYVGCCGYLFIQMITRANDAGQATNELLQSYPIGKEGEQAFILGIPDNYHGLYLFRDYTDDALSFKESLTMFYNMEATSEIIDVAQFNQMTPIDGMNATIVGDSLINVGFDQYGNWFWRTGIGMSNYETDEFLVEIKSGYYQLKLKNPNARQRFLFPKQGKWQTLRWPE